MTPPPGAPGTSGALGSDVRPDPGGPDTGGPDTPGDRQAGTREAAPAKRRITPLELAAMAVPTVILAVMGWRQRWITDDGLIFTRAVRQILAGNGPVYSVGERVETSTSTLWQWLLALLGAITPFDLARIAVYTGLFLTVAGLWLSLDGSRRLFRGMSVERLLLPVGALVFVAVPSVWDFSTAGMETGLIVFWIGASWWLLVGTWSRAATVRPLRRTLAVAAFFGLGPLVRPDLGLTMLVLLAAQIVLTGVRWRGALGIVAAAGFLPAAYEVFRMGYYGVVFPMPALTKEASESLWGRGWDYLTDYIAPYHLWIPMILLPVVGALLLRLRRPGDRRTITLIAAPLVAALGQTLYVLKVGGDFMHGRMWLPILLLVLLPLMLAPIDRLATPVVALVAVWAVVCGGFLRSGYITTPAPGGVGAQVWNERDTYTNWTGTDNPTREAEHARTLPGMTETVRDSVRNGERRVFLDPDYRVFPPGTPPLPLRADLPNDSGLIIGRLGVGGVVTPIDGIVVDVWGLANTVGAHIEQTQRVAAGHEKLLPAAWNIALYVDPSGDHLIPPSVATPEAIRAARAALGCGDLKELVDSVTEPMSASRFLDNLTGAFGRTKLRIPADPVEAERKFCAPS